jgi:hypothetical protein
LLAGTHFELLGRRTDEEQAGSEMGLGDWVCIEGDCQIGRSLIREMGAVYTALVAQVGTQDFVNRFGSTVQSIQATLSDMDSWAVHWVPFHPGCCTIKELGRRAQDITRQMREAAGVAQPPDTDTDSGDPLGTLLQLVKWTLVTGVVAVGAFGVYWGIKAVKETTTERRRYR